MLIWLLGCFRVGTVKSASVEDPTTGATARTAVVPSKPPLRVHEIEGPFGVGFFLSLCHDGQAARAHCMRQHAANFGYTTSEPKSSIIRA